MNNILIVGDCLEKMAEIETNSIDLIVTSPPYANQRKKSYGGIDPSEYVNWFLLRSKEMYRILKQEGSFILNIKESVQDGQRLTYVLELILALKNQNWLWTDEYIWHKKNAAPGKWPNRFRDAWERCLHFTKNKKFAMYQDNVMIAIGDWKNKRLKTLNENDLKRSSSATKSGIGRKLSNWKDKELVYPSNVLNLASECGNKLHPAVFPIELPKWFINLFTKPQDIVLDPFIGSGTTAIAALELGRNYIGIDISQEYIDLANKRIYNNKGEERTQAISFKGA